MKIQRNSVTIEINQTTDQYGHNRAVARIDGRQVAVGEVPGIPDQAYPRIVFSMKPPAELYEQADSRGKFVDNEYTESEKSINARPIDTCTFNLTDAEAQQITRWRFPAA